MGLGVLMKAGSDAADSGPRPSMTEATTENVNQLHGDELFEAAQRGLEAADLANVAGSRSLAAPDGSAPDSLSGLSSMLREADESTGQ